MKDSDGLVQKVSGWTGMMCCLRRVVQLKLFDECRKELLAVFAEIEAKGRYDHVESDYPWISELFVFGLLDSEDALNEARIELLNSKRGQHDDCGVEIEDEWRRCYANLTLTPLQRQPGNGLSDECIRAMQFPKELTKRSLNMAWYWLHYVGCSNHSVQKRVLEEIRDALVQEDENGRIERVRGWFLGRCKMIPCPLTPDWKYRYLSQRVAPEDVKDLECRKFGENYELLSRTDVALQRKLELQLSECETSVGQGFQQTRSVLMSPTNVPDVMRLGEISQSVRTRIANGCMAREVLWKRLFEIAERLNQYGSGAIPAWHLEKRQGRGGDWISATDESCYSVREVIGSIVSSAVAVLSGFEKVEGIPVTTYRLFRDYQDGNFSDKYLTALFEDVLNNCKFKVLLPKSSGPIIKVPLDGQKKNGEEKASGAIDEIKDERIKPYDDSTAYYLDLIEEIAPRWARYYRLTVFGIEKSERDELVKSGFADIVSRYKDCEGIKKGDALKLVGASSTHFVSRERDKLIEELKKRAEMDLKEVVARLERASKKEEMS